MPRRQIKTGKKRRAAQKTRKGHKSPRILRKLRRIRGGSSLKLIPAEPPGKISVQDDGPGSGERSEPGNKTPSEPKLTPGYGVKEIYEGLKQGFVDTDERTVTVAWYKHIISSKQLIDSLIINDRILD